MIAVYVFGLVALLAVVLAFAQQDPSAPTVTVLLVTAIIAGCCALAWLPENVGSL